MKTQILFAIVGGAGFGVAIGTALTVLMRGFGFGRPPTDARPRPRPDITDSGGPTSPYKGTARRERAPQPDRSPAR